MMGATYPTKKALKENVGERLRYVETSLFGPEYQSDGKFTVVGPSPQIRKWFAEVTLRDDIIVKVT